MSDDAYSRSHRTNDPYARGAGAPAVGSEDDPLTELARLIGQGDAVDQQGGWQQAPGQAPQGGYDGYHYPEAHAADPRYDARQYQNHQNQAYADQHQQQHQAYADPHQHQAYADQQHQAYADQHYQGQAYQQEQYQHGYEQPMYGQGAPQSGYQMTPYYGNHHPPHDDDYDEPPSRRGGFFTVIVVLGVAVAGTTGAFAYRALFSGAPRNTPPVILADSTPSKIVPAATDNADKPVDSAQTERVVPREEPPIVNWQSSSSGSPRVVFPNSAGSQSTQQSQQPVQQQPVTTGTLTPQTGTTNEPRKVRTVVITPGQAASDPFNQSAQQRVASNGARWPAKSQTAPDQQGDAPLSLSPQAVGSDQTAPARGMRLASAPNKSPTAILPSATSSSSTSSAVVGSGSFNVQVSAQKSEEDAQTTFRALQAKYPDQLSGRELIIRKKDLPIGVFYGVQVGPFASKDEAVQLCESLKSAGGSCMLQRN
jgi:hypothetical protein